MHKFWLLFLLVVTSVAVGGFAFAQQKDAPSTGSTSASKWKGDACVESVPVMRREHMDFLLHQRDETMRRGIRAGRYSLKKCIECHIQKDEHGQIIPVNASGQFCRECHQYAAVNIDCFQCHIATVDTEE